MKTDRIEPVCAIGTLETLKTDVLKDDWVNTAAQKNVAAGIGLAIEKLHKAGFRKVSGDELAIIPVQLELDYGTLRSQQ